MTNPADPVLSYAGNTARVSRLALVAFILAIVGTLTFFLVIPGFVALIFAAIADHRITKNPAKLAGKGYTVAAATLGLCSILFGLVTVVLIPSHGHPRELANRSSCAANLRGIASAMAIYSSTNNDHFPIVTYAPYSPALNSHTASAPSVDAEDVIKSYYKAPFPQAGSSAASLWILSLQGMSPKLFVCKSDTYNAGPAAVVDPDKKYFNNFQSDQLSYSAAYPWKADGTVGKWWTNTADASLPILSDMAPENGTGSGPKVNVIPSTSGGLPPGGTKAWSSPNHQRDGQNVAYADIHVDYQKRADVGCSNDNIWTSSAVPSIGPSEFGIPATKSSPALTRDEPPYDIIMYPIRNLDTGRL